MKNIYYLCVFFLVIKNDCLYAVESEWSHSFNAISDFRIVNDLYETNPLVTEDAISNKNSNTESSTSRLNLESWNDKTNVSTQIRFKYENNQVDNVNSETEIDEFFGEYEFTDELFIFAGRRNIVLGQSYGINPIDVFSDYSLLDRSLNSSRKRIEYPGQDMLGFENLYDEGSTISGYIAPKISFSNNERDQALLSKSMFLSEFNSDFSILGFIDERSGLGFSFTKPQEKASLFYADVSLREGRDRALIRADTSSSVEGDFLTIEGDQKKLYLESNVGFSYAFHTGGTFNIEYYFNQNGYTNPEWLQIKGLILTNSNNVANGVDIDQSESNLNSLNSYLTYEVLRREYVFMRYFSSFIFDEDSNFETTVFHSLEDGSGSLSVRLEKSLISDLLIGLYLNSNYGNSYDEFKLRANQFQGVAYATYHF